MARKKTTNEFVQEFKEIFGEDEYFVTGEYVNSVTPIEITHKCGHKLSRDPNHLLTRKTCCCPICESKLVTLEVIPYVNDIYATNPELYEMLLNKEDGHKYKENSNKKTWFCCPDCGEHIYATICNVNGQGLSCSRCGVKISYPEKFMNELLHQANIEFNYQFTPKWANGCRYDFAFDMGSKKYIVETDGGIGHGESSMQGGKDTKGIIIDHFKDSQAFHHGYTVFRIDCKYTDIRQRFEYIKNNILNSELASIIDMSKIDFNRCNVVAEKSSMVYISELWNSGIHGYDNLKTYLDIDRSTIRRYLKVSSEIGLISETYEEILKINRQYSNIKLAKSKGNAVKCNETEEIFHSYAEAKRKYGCDLCRYFDNNGKHKYSGTLSDGTRLTWTKLN